MIVSILVGISTIVSSINCLYYQDFKDSIEQARDAPKLEALDESTWELLSHQFLLFMRKSKTSAFPSQVAAGEIEKAIINSFPFLGDPSPFSFRLSLESKPGYPRGRCGKGIENVSKCERGATSMFALTGCCARSDYFSCYQKHANFIKENRAAASNLDFEALIAGWNDSEKYGTCVDQQSQLGQKLTIAKLIVNADLGKDKLDILKGLKAKVNEMYENLSPKPYYIGDPRRPYQYHALMFDIDRKLDPENVKVYLDFLQIGQEAKEREHMNVPGEAYEYRYTGKFTKTLLERTSFPLAAVAPKFGKQIVDEWCSTKKHDMFSLEYCNQVVEFIQMKDNTWSVLEKVMTDLEEAKLEELTQTAHVKMLDKPAVSQFIRALTSYVKMYSLFAQGNFFKSFQHIILAAIQYPDLYGYFNKFEDRISRMKKIMSGISGKSVAVIRKAVNDKYILELDDKEAREARNKEMERKREERQRLEVERKKQEHSEYLAKTEGARKGPENAQELRGDLYPLLNLGKKSEEKIKRLIEKLNESLLAESKDWKLISRLYAKIDYFMYPTEDKQDDFKNKFINLEELRKAIFTSAEKSSQSISGTGFWWIEPNASSDLVYKYKNKAAILSELEKDEYSVNEVNGYIAGGNELIDVRSECRKALEVAYLLISAKKYEKAIGMLGVCECNDSIIDSGSRDGEWWKSVDLSSPTCLLKSAGIMYAQMAEGEDRARNKLDYSNEYKRAFDRAIVAYNSALESDDFAKFDVLAAVAQLIYSYDRIKNGGVSAIQYLEEPMRMSVDSITLQQVENMKKTNSGRQQLGFLEAIMKFVERAAYKNQSGKVESAIFKRAAGTQKYAFQLSYAYAVLQSNMQEYVPALKNWRIAFASRISDENITIRKGFEQFIRICQDKIDVNLGKIAAKFNLEHTGIVKQAPVLLSGMNEGKGAPKVSDRMSGYLKSVSAQRLSPTSYASTNTANSNRTVASGRNVFEPKRPVDKPTESLSSQPTLRKAMTQPIVRSNVSNTPAIAKSGIPSAADRMANLKKAMEANQSAPIWKKPVDLFS